MKDKPLRIYISKDKWNDAKHTVRDGILKKLSAAKQNLSIDKDIAAGIYVYALEEFGKLLLMKDCKKVDGRYIIKYRNEFVSHRIKFGKAFDYLQNNHSDEYIILNNENNYTSDLYSWKKFSIELIVETEARLGIFYVDFSDLQNNKDKYGIMKIPHVDENKLKGAINELENVVNNFEL